MAPYSCDRRALRVLDFLDVSTQSLADQHRLTPSLDRGPVTERDGDVLVDINSCPNHAYMLTHTTDREARRSGRLFVGKKLADLDHDVWPRFWSDTVPGAVGGTVSIDTFFGRAKDHELPIDEVEHPILGNLGLRVQGSLRVEVVAQ